MKKETHGSIKSYTVGFLLSIILTLAAFAFVMLHVQSHHAEFSHQFLLIIIVVLAIAQLFIQLIFFLHLGKKSTSQWNRVVMIFAVIVITILVAGSLWIMQNLDYNMMQSPAKMDKYMNSQDGF